MPTRRHRATPQRSILETAGRGAIAGLAGAAAMVAAERLVLPRLPDRKHPRVFPWEARVAEAGEWLGYHLEPRTRRRTAVASQLLAGAALGAAYAVAQDRLVRSREGRRLLNAGLAFVVSAVAPELPRRRLRRKGSRARRLTLMGLQPITPADVFDSAAGLALRALVPSLKTLTS